MNLEGSAASFLEQFPDGVRSELQKQERNLERFGSVAFTGFGIVLGIGVLGLLYWIFDKVVLSGSDPLQGILLMAFIIFASLMLGYVVRRESLNEKRQKLGMAPVPTYPLPDASTDKLLHESTVEPVPSIVEHTTELLVESKGRRSAFKKER